MFEILHTLSDGRNVRIVHPDPTSWYYVVYDEAGNEMGTIWIDGENGTEDDLLKPYETELVELILNKTTPEL